MASQADKVGFLSNGSVVETKGYAIKIQRKAN